MEEVRGSSPLSSIRRPTTAPGATLTSNEPHSLTRLLETLTVQRSRHQSAPTTEVNR
jgi:hypothetical protein